MGALLRFKKVDPKQVRDLFGKVQFLKKENMITEDVYLDAVKELCPWMGEEKTQEDGGGYDCDNE
jgi:hypothetical protein